MDKVKAPRFQYRHKYELLLYTRQRNMSRVLCRIWACIMVYRTWSRGRDNFFWITSGMFEGTTFWITSSSLKECWAENIVPPLCTIKNGIILISLIAFIIFINTEIRHKNKTIFAGWSSWQIFIGPWCMDITQAPPSWYPYTKIQFRFCHSDHPANMVLL